MVNLPKILAIKFFRITHQIHAGYASQFVKAFSSRLLRISTIFNCGFQVEAHQATISRTTSPYTSVNRKSLPANR